jgi:hypothetical protein
VGGESIFKRPSPRFSCGFELDTPDIRIMLALMSPNPSESESLRRQAIPARFHRQIQLVA